MRVFVNYRTEDEPYAAQLIDEKLCERFGQDNVFFDNRAIGLGRDFKPELWDSLARCDVLVVVIGPKWPGARDDGTRRLDDADDYVRQEIAFALRTKKYVLPVLVGPVPTLRTDDLPADVAALAHRQYQRLATRGARHDVARLVEAIANLPATESDQPTSPPTVTLIHLASPGDAGTFDALRSAVAAAAEEARLTGVDIANRRGGVALLVPDRIPRTRLVVTFVRILRQWLAEQPRPLRIKMAVHEGLVGVPSGADAVDRAEDLLALGQLDDVLREASRAPIVLVLSQLCFDDAREAHVDLAAYARVPIGGGQCWLHVPGYPWPPGLAGGEPAPDPAPAPPGSGTPVPPVSAQSVGVVVGTAHGNVYGGDHIEGGQFNLGEIALGDLMRGRRDAGERP